MTPQSFLKIGGVILILVGLLGFVGILGPTEEKSLFGSTWWFDQGENWAHLFLGIVALLAATKLKDESAKRTLVMILGVVGLLIGVVGFFLTSDAPNFFGANLENPLDNILHLAVGAWAIASSKKKTTATPSTNPSQ